ncbi:MAG: ABC transporter substrate-binding protein [Sulfolobales archaeon]
MRDPINKAVGKNTVIIVLLVVVIISLLGYIAYREAGSLRGQGVITVTSYVSANVSVTQITTVTQPTTVYRISTMTSFFNHTITYTAVYKESREVVVVDALNRTLIFDKLPEKIVVSGRGARYLLDVLYLFKSAPKRVLAFDVMFKDDPILQLLEPDLDKKAVFSGTPTVETLVSMRPDLIIMKSAFKRDGDVYENAGLRVMYVDPETPQGFFRDLINIGKVMGEENRAEQIAKFMREILAYVNSKISASGVERPKTLFLYYSVKGSTVSVKVPPSGYLQNVLIELAGGESVSKSIPGGQWVEVNIEQIINWNPSIIFVVTYSSNPSPVDVVNKLLNDPMWRDIDAVKNKRVYPVPGLGYAWDMPGPKWPMFIIYAASKMHPDLFKEFNLRQFVVDYYSRIYDIDLLMAEKIAIYDLKGVVS